MFLWPRLGLQASGIDAVVSQLVTAGLSQRVRVNREVEPCGCAQALSMAGERFDRILRMLIAEH